MSDKPILNQAILETERLFLKELNPDIIFNLFNFYRDDEIKAFLGLHTENELEIERMRFERGLTTFRISFKNFLLVDKKTKRIIGRTGFHAWYFDHFRAELGYAITDDDFLGQGYMTEANQAVVKYGFEKMDLNRIEAFVAPYNIQSLKILKSLGFKEEGILREHYFTNNRIEDSICFGLLKREYHK